MGRVIVHAGFHKTGTTTVQKTLRQNRAALRPFARIVLRPGMVPLCDAARAYSKSRSAWDLGLVAAEAVRLAETQSAHRTVLISSEDLSGHMPGRHGLRGYDSAPRLAVTLRDAWAEVHPETRVTFLYGLRAPDPWLTSCYAQHLRASRMTLSRKDYLNLFRASAGLEHVVDAVGQAAPDMDTARFSLEACTGPLGPVAPLLALAAVPPKIQATLTALPAQNAALPETTLRAFLDLNRSDLPDAEVKSAKQALLAQPG